MKDKEKKHLLRWFLGLMEDRLPIYLFCILISSMGTAFSKIANAWIVESVVSAAQSRNPDGLLIRILIQFLAFVSGWCLWRMGIMHYNIEGRIGTAKLEKRVFAKAMRLPQTAGSDNRSGSLSASHDVLQSTVDIVSVIDKCGNLSGKSLFCTSYETGRKRTGTE